MPIESSQNLTGQSISGLRPVGAVEARAVRTAASISGQASAGAQASGAAASAATFQPSSALDAGQPPVDAERIAMIRHAIQTGAYPVIPTKIADAMIAAGLLLRTSQ